MGFATKVTKAITAPARKSKVLPENAGTTQGVFDIFRGKAAPTGSSLLGKPLAQIGRNNSLITGQVKKTDSRGRSLS